MTGLIVTILVLAALYLVACDVIYRVVADRRCDIEHLPRPRAMDGFSPWEAYIDEIELGAAWFTRQDAKRVTVKSHDGLTLSARYLPAEGSDRTLLLAHGYRSKRAEFDFSGALEAYHKMGYNVLLIDQRAHGASEGRYIGFGVSERHDIVTWIGFLNGRYRPRHIVLDGMSMGSATVLMALDLDLPDEVAGAIVDCGFTTPRAIIGHVMKTATGLPVAPFWPGIELFAKLRSGYFLSGASATESVKKARIPVLFVHGEDDKYVPCAMGRENYAACASRKRLVTVPGAGHGMSFLVDRPSCGGALTAFLDSLDKA